MIFKEAGELGRQLRIDTTRVFLKLGADRFNGVMGAVTRGHDRETTDPAERVELIRADIARQGLQFDGPEDCREALGILIVADLFNRDAASLRRRTP